tara:strand:- start:815 stop:1048 length:234 start_codon:yes stop_codon:yes gene_type:complete
MTQPVYRFTDEKMTLEKVQELVGGYIAEVHVGNPAVQYWVNEEGLMLELPHNEEASEILGQPIVGPLVALSGKSRLT